MHAGIVEHHDSEGLRGFLFNEKRPELFQKRVINHTGPDKYGSVRTVNSDYLLAMAVALECTVSELVGDPRLALLITEKQIEVAKEMVAMDSHIDRVALLASLRCDGLLPAIADEPPCDEQW